MRGFLLALAAAAVLAVPAASASTAVQGPGGFVVWELHATEAGHWPRLWKRIHPAQRAHVKAPLYVLCNAQAAKAWKFTDIRVTAVKNVRASVPGTKLRRIAAKSVTIHLDLKSPEGLTTSAKQTVNVFRVKGVWYSALTAAQYKAYAAGHCVGVAKSG